MSRKHVKIWEKGGEWFLGATGLNPVRVFSPDGVEMSLKNGSHILLKPGWSWSLDPEKSFVYTVEDGAQQNNHAVEATTTTTTTTTSSIPTGPTSNTNTASPNAGVDFNMTSFLPVEEKTGELKRTDKEVEDDVDSIMQKANEELLEYEKMKEREHEEKKKEEKEEEKSNDNSKKRSRDEEEGECK